MTVSANVHIEPARPLRVASLYRVIDAFLDAQADSAATRRSYASTLRAAFARMDIVNLDDLTGIDLTAWRQWLLTGSGLAPSTAATYVTVVRSFLRWSRRVGACTLSEDVLAMTLRRPRFTTARPYATLGREQLRALRDACNDDQQRLILGLLVGAGLRRSEVVALDVRHFTDDPGEPTLHVHGKGRRERVIPIPLGLAAMLRAACKGREPRDPIVVVTRGTFAGRRLAPAGVENVVRRLVARARIAGDIPEGRRVSPHAFRHTFAVASLRHHGEVVATSKLLGHADLSTTLRYVDHLRLDEIAKAVPPFALED